MSKRARTARIRAMRPRIPPAFSSAASSSMDLRGWPVGMSPVS
jgi:hypothetical protein